MSYIFQVYSKDFYFLATLSYYATAGIAFVSGILTCKSLKVFSPKKFCGFLFLFLFTFVPVKIN